MNPLVLLRSGLAAWMVLAVTAGFTAHLERERSHTPALGLHSPEFPMPREFRSVLAGWAYVKADQYFHEGKWERIAPILRARATLDPALTDSWSTGAWHLAFNLSEKADHLEDRKKFIESGIAFLEEGIRKNPGTAHLYFDLGWIHWMRLGDPRRAAELFRRSLELEPSRQAAIWLDYLSKKQGKAGEKAESPGKSLSPFPGDEAPGIYIEHRHHQ